MLKTPFINSLSDYLIEYIIQSTLLTAIMYGIKIIIIMIPVVLKCPHCGAIVVGQVRPNSGGGNYAVCSSCGRSVSFTYSANSTAARIDHVG